MSGISAIVLSFLAFLAVPLTIEGIDRLAFSYSGFKKVKEQWQILVERFGLEVIFSKSSGLGWVKGFKITATGFFEGYYFNCFWERKKRYSIGNLRCKIELQNPRKLTFTLDKEQTLFKKGNVILNDAYFKEHFNLSSNDATAMGLIFDDVMIQKVRKVFAIELHAELFVEKQKAKTQKGDALLDEKDTYYLVYSNSKYPFNSKKERLFIEETLSTMLEISKKIDELKPTA